MWLPSRYRKEGVSNEAGFNVVRIYLSILLLYYSYTSISTFTRFPMLFDQSLMINHAELLKKNVFRAGMANCGTFTTCGFQLPEFSVGSGILGIIVHRS